MTALQAIEFLSKFDSSQQIEVVLDKKKYPVKEIKQGAEHFIPQSGEVEERKFVLIQI